MNRDNNPNVKGFPMFLLSLIPGAAHMYMGLMKRGAQLLVCFGIIFSILVSDIWYIQSIVLPFLLVVYAYSFFDGYSCLRRIRSGEKVPDESIFKEFGEFDLKKINKMWVGVIISIVGLFLILSVIRYNHHVIDIIRDIAGFAMDALPAVIFMVIGIWLIVRGRKEKKQVKEELKENEINLLEE